jgi:hypothetical protein
MTEKGLRVSIYKSGPDCTNDGVTANATSAVLVNADGCPRVPEIFGSNGDVPELIIGYDVVGGKTTYYATPNALPPDGRTGYMFGGNFIYSEDSRFPFDYPVPVHDRTETWEQYEQLSR